MTMKAERCHAWCSVRHLHVGHIPPAFILRCSLHYWSVFVMLIDTPDVHGFILTVRPVQRNVWQPVQSQLRSTAMQDFPAHILRTSTSIGTGVRAVETHQI